MTSARKFVFSVLILTILSVALLCSAAAQNGLGSLKGQVTDPSGAVLVSATVTAKSSTGQTFSTATTRQGSYEIKGLQPGKYTVTAAAKGFDVYVLTDVDVPASQEQMLDITMGIAVEKEHVTVEDSTANVEVDPANNSSATVIKGKDLDALSDDPDELASDLQALAGPSAGPNGGQIYIDGFTNGQLPPKNAIREIRVNQNPFSAQFDRLGYGRVEVFTKPGMDNFHGQFMFNENNSIFNSLSPFSPLDQPDYHSEMYTGNVSGPINKKSSFFFNVERRNIRDVSLVNAHLDPSNPQTTFLDAIPNPRLRTSISPRLDYQLTNNNTLMVRYQYNNESTENNGVGGFNLATQAYNAGDDAHNLTVSDTQIVNPHVINETRFQWYHDREVQNALNNGVTISVPGAFTSGGSSVGNQLDSENHYEVQNYTSMSLGKHFVKYGARIRANKATNEATSGFNGTYTFTDLAQYAAGIPSQFTITKGNPRAEVTWMDAGLYLEDDWKIRPNFTLSYGLRFETQNHISDHADFAPRIGFAWGLGSSKSTPKTVLRAGFGIFYDRFNQDLVLRTIRNNGTNQETFVLSSQDGPIQFCPTFTPSCPQPSAVGVTPTINIIDPNLRSPYMMQSAVTLERQITKTATASVTYLNSRGEHTFVSQNINAPDPTTGVPVNATLYGNGNVYQYESEGIFRQNQLIANTNIRMGGKFTLFSFYSLNYARSDTAGAGSFPSNPFNIAADYGRASFDVRNRFMIGGNFNFPYRFSLSPFIIANAGSPYNITTGDDFNGDSIYNDRPAFAPTGVSFASNCSPAARGVTPSDPGARYCMSPLGVLDMRPDPGAKLIPINYGTGPANFTVNLRVSKVFGFGKESGGASGAQGGDHRGPGGMGGRGGPGGGMRPGMGPGGPFGGGNSTTRRYNLTLSASARNLFNRVNLAVPVGNLSSPSFGESLALAGGPFGSNASNRRIDLQLQFAF